MEKSSMKIKFVFAGLLLKNKALMELNILKSEKTHNEAHKIFESVQKLSEASYEQRNKIGSGDNVYFFIIKKTNHGPIFYFVETKANYPDRSVFQFIDELVSNDTVSPDKTENHMKEDTKKIVEQYQTVEILDTVMSDMNDIKLEINKSIQSQIKNLENVNELKEKSDHIKLGADSFRKDARELERITCWNNWKWRIIIFLLITGVALVIILPIVLTKK
jgi:hypothetical protein